MTSALIGHTGFVGSNLARQRRFDECYNSKNIEEIATRSFDLIVCSGAPAEKWKANQDPEADRRVLDRLWTNLKQAQADRIVLISTVDVYARPILVDESVDVDDGQATAYGRHRRELERRVADHFPTLVVRLPGLFGPGLKKNAIHDFLYQHEMHKIDSRSVYQFYGLDRLWSDIETALPHELTLLNFATEPVSIAEVAREGFGMRFTNTLDREPARYDFRTQHAAHFGGSDGYILKKSSVLAEIRQFVKTFRGTKQCA